MGYNKNYLLALLTVILTFNYMDRIALGIVVQDIKVDLNLSDTQLGFISGIAFALFYAVLGVPIARWADRGNRVRIIALSATIWSVAVALCGAVGNFMQLMLIRVVAGIGESGCVPPSMSLIASYFTRDERPRAASIYLQGVSVSLFIGYFAAGWLDEHFGWRIMFVVIGLPGLGLALLSVTTLSDPRAGQAGIAVERSSHLTFRQVCSFLWKTVTFRHLLLSLAVSWFFSYGALQWTPAFFTRSFGLKAGELGAWFAVIYGTAYVAGTYLGGEWAARRARRNERSQLKAMAVTTAVSAVFAAMVYMPWTAPNYYLAFLWLGLSQLTGAAVNGPQFAMIQTLVPENMQAVAIATVYMVGNLVGMGLGPWAAGALSDALRSAFAEDSLRYAMLILCPGYLWSAWHFWKARKTVAPDIEQVQTWNIKSHL